MLQINSQKKNQLEGYPGKIHYNHFGYFANLQLRYTVAQKYFTKEIFLWIIKYYTSLLLNISYLQKKIKLST